MESPEPEERGRGLVTDSGRLTIEVVSINESIRICDNKTVDALFLSLLIVENGSDPTHKFFVSDLNYVCQDVANTFVGRRFLI